MSLRFASLGSGSRGNALIVETPHVRVLIDCGFPAREIESRLARLAVDPRSLGGIFLTHEHGDHMRGVGAMARRYGLPVWMTAGTYRAARYGKLPQWHPLDCHRGWIALGDLRILPFPVPHDAREPCQFLLQCGDRRLGLLTDTGYVTPHIRECLQACDSLVLEFNHDRNLLASGPYPPRLKARVGGVQGHLSNDQALQLLADLPHERLNHLLASHLSETNNHGDAVVVALQKAVPSLEERLHIASQDRVTSWFELA